MSVDTVKPLVLCLVGDLYFSVRIETAAERSGLQVLFIEQADQIVFPGLRQQGNQFSEQPSDPNAILLDSLQKMNPVLIICDLNNQWIPWREWISLIASTPATRRIPIICFGSHKDINAFQAAQAAGARAVFARSRFVEELPELIRKYARMIDQKALEEACQQPLSDRARLGLQAFNQGDFFEAHEYLEEAWKADQTIGRDLYQAVLQIAVAYYQITRGNYRGASKMFRRVRQWLDPLPDTCRGIDIAALRVDAQRVNQLMVELGPARMAELDRGLLLPVRYQEGDLLS